MNELLVPPAPHWYKSSVVACAPDNTLVYGSKNDIVVIKKGNPDEPAKIQIIHGAHPKHVTSVSLNRKWKEPHSYLASLGEDNVVKVWNVDTLEKKTSNKDHTEHKEPVIGAVFAGDDRVVSAASHGLVIVWNINTNESKPLSELFKTKVNLTCLSSCPHAGWLLAFGLNNGSVVVADLRRNGHVLYNLRGHYQPVVSLSWCPAPVNIFPRHTNNKVKNKSLEVTNESASVEPSSSTKVNPWVNLVHADSDMPPKKEDASVEQFQDFLKECDDLKNKILGLEPNVTVLNENEKICLEENVVLEKERKIQKSEIHTVQNRPLPTIFDPSGDFLDDSGIEEKKIEEPDQEIDKSNLSDQATKSEEEENVENSCLLENEQNDGVEEEPRTEYLLASSGKDKSVYIWRAGTDGRMQTFFYVSKKGKRNDKKLGVFVSVCWVAANTILTSSATGEVIAWTVPKPKNAQKHFSVVHHEHSSSIFNIVTPPKYMSAYNWQDKVDLNVWTWGQDGKLVNYDLNAEKVCSSYATVTSIVTCFSSSALDPNRLAIGMRDGCIRVWDLSLPHSTIVTMQKHQQKFTYKVSAIAWHPTKEMIIGFGTEEGRVGFIDLASKKITLLSNYFHKEVYKVEWGPLMGDSINLGLYVIAEGKMAIYSILKPDEEPSQLELPEKTFVYNFAWKPDYSLLLLNGKDGSLVVLKSDLKEITTLYPNEKGLNAIVWHPDAFSNDTEISVRCNWVAASTTKGVIILDCGSIEANSNFSDKLVVSFEGHLKPPLALAWSPFDGNKIVSTAADGLAHVWDVSAKSLIATFVNSYFCHNSAVAWSPVDPNFIIVGDKIIQIWNILQHPPKADAEFLAERKRLMAKAVKSEPKKVVEKTTIKVDIPSKNKSISKNCIVPSFYVSNDENISRQVTTMRQLMSEPVKNDDKLLDTFHLLDKNDDKLLDPFHLFGTKEQVSILLDANYHQQKKEGKYASCEMISLWKGNMAEHILNAINENRVTPSIIALAPMISPKLWQDACCIYARKLSEDVNSDPLEVAMYFLACHRVEEAINSLCLNSLFKEALALAKQRLPENSEIIKQVVEKWAAHCIQTGNFENAAYCYISIKNYEDAAKVLSRRNQIEFLEFALELAEKAENKGLCDSIRFKCTELKSDQKDHSDPENELANSKTSSDTEDEGKVQPELDKNVNNEE